MKLRLKVQHGGLKRGEEYSFGPRLTQYLLKTGKAEVVKEEKSVPETKEEKFKPETKSAIFKSTDMAPVRDFSEVPISKLRTEIFKMTDEELQNIVDSDNRISAVKLARNELGNR